MLSAGGREIVVVTSEVMVMDVVDVKEKLTVRVNVAAGSVTMSVSVDANDRSKVAVEVPPGRVVVVVDVRAVGEGQVVGCEVVLLDDELDELVIRQEQALEILEGR